MLLHVCMTLTQAGVVMRSGGSLTSDFSFCGDTNFCCSLYVMNAESNLLFIEQKAQLLSNPNPTQHINMCDCL